MKPTKMFLLFLCFANLSEANEECLPVKGDCVGENQISSYDRVEYQGCMALCQTITGCEHVTWHHVSQQLGSCHLLTSCDNLNMHCLECFSSKVCPRNGPVVKIGKNDIDIIIHVNNKEWMRYLFYILCIDIYV